MYVSGKGASEKSIWQLMQDALFSCFMAVLCSLFPVRGAGTKGRPYNDIRTTVNGIIWLARSGAPWRDLPERYGKWHIVEKISA